MLFKIPFFAAKKIRKIPKEIFEDGYRFGKISFKVESLFTSISLSTTINIILDWIYNQKLLTIKIKKPTTKKLLKDCCTKNAFTFNNVTYQWDHV